MAETRKECEGPHHYPWVADVWPTSTFAPNRRCFVSGKITCLKCGHTERLPATSLKSRAGRDTFIEFLRLADIGSPHD